MVGRLLTPILVLALCAEAEASASPAPGLDPAAIGCRAGKLGARGRALPGVLRGWRSSPAPFADNPGLDVDHYDFAISIDPTGRELSGTATLTVDAVADDVSVLVLDLLTSLTVTGATVDGMDAVLDHEPNRLLVLLPDPVSTGDRIVVTVEYRGVIDYYATALGPGGLGFSDSEGAPWVYSIDEPFGAHSWLPVVEDVEDKATWSMDVTVPAGLVVASNGVEVAPPSEAEGTTTFHWATEYANSIYLLMVAIGNYTVLEDTYVGLHGESMPVLTYTFASVESETETLFANLVPMIEQLAQWFGEYPFIDEKYGHALYGFGGAMEHSTLTSIYADYVQYPATWAQATIVHELGHQWFGDSVSPANWEHIWLNESFATYIEALWDEARNPATIRDYGSDLWTVSYDGTVIAEDPNAPFDDSAAIYDRGARVLHMLRHELGDTAFFDGLRAYYQQYAGSSATTEQFRDAMEGVAGVDLDWFFDQWIYRPGRPELVTWFRPYTAGSEPRVTVYLEQVQAGPLYRLSVDLDVSTGDAVARHVRQQISGDNRFTVLDLPSPSGAVTAVDIDPDGVLLANIIDNGEMARTRVPVARVVGDRRAGIGSLHVTLSIDSEEDLSGYTASWLVGAGTASSTSGETITVDYASSDLGGYWRAYTPMVILQDGDGNQIRYPWFEVRLYDPDPYGAAAAGDLNRDGVVNGIDLALVAAARGLTDDRADRVLRGDVDDDGDIDDDDVDQVAARFGTVLGGAK